MHLLIVELVSTNFRSHRAIAITLKCQWLQTLALLIFTNFDKNLFNTCFNYIFVLLFLYTCIYKIQIYIEITLNLILNHIHACKKITNILKHFVCDFLNIFSLFKNSRWHWYGMQNKILAKTSIVFHIFLII